MKTLLLILSFLIISPELFAGPNRVYFLDGYFYRKDRKDNPYLYKIAEKLQNFVVASHPDTQFYFIHNTEDKKVCADLQSLSPADYPDHLVLVGHSYGTGAALAIANCLQDKKVDLMILVDAITRFQGPFSTTIPDNVGVAYNFFQRQDIALNGTTSFSRSSENQKPVSNEFMTVTPADVSNHWKIIGELVLENERILKLIDQSLSNQ